MPRLSLPPSLARLPVLAVPHRVFFAAGVLQLLFALAWWSAELGLRLSPLGGMAGLVGLALPARWVHALLAVYSFFPLFIFGFLMTVIPRWLGLRPLAQGEYGLPALAMVAGWLLADVALLAGWSLVPGMLLAAAGWLWGVQALVQRVRAPHAARQHAVAVLAAATAGAAGLLLLILALATGSGTGIHWALQIGLWAYLVPVLVIVVHRMLPFFTTSALPQVRPWNPLALLWGLLAASLCHGLLAGLGLAAWLWLADLPLAVLAGLFSVRLGLRASFRVPLLATHHVAVLWLAVAMALSALQSLALLAGVAVGGLAPLHALTIGFFLSLVFGMGTRVTLGHSGQVPAASPLVWRLFWGLQALVVLRLCADLVPSALAGGHLLVAAGGVLLVFALWAGQYLPVLLRRRADGQPG